MKRFIKSILVGGISLAMVVAMSDGCLAGRMASAASKPKLNQKKIVLKVGQTKKLKVKKTKKKVIWKSNKKKIATVSKKGLVKAKKVGKAVITARVGGKKLKCKVTVKPKTSVPSKSTGSKKPGAGSGTGETNQTGTTAKPGKTDPPDATVEPGGSDQPNTTKVPEVSQQPEETAEPKTTLEVSHSSGTYESAFTLTLSSKPGAEIYYTMDGSNPVTSETRQVYSNGIAITDRKNDRNVLAAVPQDKIQTMNNAWDLIIPSDRAVDKCTVLRAVAVSADGEQSDIMTNTYFVGDMSQHISGIQDSVRAAGQDLAVISITMDKDDLFDEKRGIYAIGSDREHPNFKEKGKAWERNCHIDYFESDGTETSLELAQDCGIRIQGNYSRENIQKSFRLFAREDYGVKNFKYPFFSGLTNAEGETMKKFKTLVLRNGGNDSFNYKYKDNFIQSFLHEQGCETLHGRPCVVYLDGEYWGHYVLQDDVSDNFLQEKRGVVKENVVVYKGSDDPKYAQYKFKLDQGELPQGVTDEDYYLQETFQFLDSHDLSNDEDYREFISKYMAEDSAVGYFASMLYLNNRYDWPEKNWSLWRTTDDARETCAYEDGRWRFSIYDLDLTTNTTWNTGGNLEGVKEDQISTLNKPGSDLVIPNLFGNMMKNESFRAKLAEKVKELATTVLTEQQVDANGEKYYGSYRPLHDQFRKRFLSATDDWFARSNYNDNIAWLKSRISYTDTLIDHVINLTGNTGNAFGDSDTILPLQNNTLIWQGKWSRTDSWENKTEAKTEGFSLLSSDGNYIELTVDSSIWGQYRKPMLQLTVAEGADDNARCHVWSSNKEMNKYFYLQYGDGEVYPWTTQAIDLSELQSNVFCVNVNDSQLIGIQIFEGDTSVES